MAGISKAGFVNLNVARALSGLVVLLAHFFQIVVMPVAGRGPITEVAIRAAEPAVFTFFILSGLLIALSIQRNIEQSQYFEWRAYAAARVARLYPALLASVAFCLVLRGILVALGFGGATALVRPDDVYAVSRAGFLISRVELVGTLLQTYAFGPGAYLAVNGPLWSLSYEVGFYVAAGLLVTVLRGRGVARPAAALALACFCWSAVSYQKTLFLHFGTLWLLGVSLYFALSTAKRSRLRTAAYLSALLAGCVAANLALMIAGCEGNLLRNCLWSVAVALLLLMLSRSERVLLGPLAKMADSTYTLYLFHFPSLLFLYALIRDRHTAAPRVYFAMAAIFALALIPACQALSKVLENRRWWESLLWGGRRDG
ncbi:MAG: acyltransferase 3 [bacterium]|jgi:peptidoglycan/LPS O-acetylase OafA/YrhL|nr:acyltransferase 3 [bacterium]